MRILGISAFYHDSAAALVDDGRIVAAAQEERFTRRKHDPRFPTNAVRWILEDARLTPDDIDVVAFYDKPFLKFERLLETYLSTAPRGFRSFAMAMPLWLKEKLFQKELLKRELKAHAPEFDWDRRLLFAERLASLGRTVQAVAHDLNTPLATIQTLAADMRAALQSAPPGAEALVRDLDESAALILDEMRRCREITQGLLGGRDRLATGSADGPTRLGEAIRRAATLVFGTGVPRARFLVESALEKRSVAMGHDSLVQVFVNLLQNAADVIEPLPEAQVRVGLLEAPPGRVWVFVDDDGPGIAPGTRDRLFEAFYTTKPPGKGTGLGLYTARSLVREAGGELTLDNAPSGGARALLDLPAGGER